MGFLSNIRDKYVVAPVANKILTDLQAQKIDTPNVFQVPIGFNSAMAQQNKRMTNTGIDWAVLRALSVTHETTRAAINVRKRQITGLEFDVVDVDPESDPEASKEKRKEIKEMITQIGGPGVRFRKLLDLMIEDVLVLDAVVLFKQRIGKRLVRLVPVDPTTIKRKVTESGETPMPPQTAFEQWIRGEKVGEFTVKEMLYEVMNPRTNSAYGLSPLESLILIVDSSLKAALYNANYLSDNNIPMGFLEMPESWSVQQIKEYKEWFDAMLTGSKNTSKVFPTPAGSKYTPASKPSDFSFESFFDYLDRKVCMLFDVTPQELGLVLKQYKENADRQDKIQIRRGIKPLAQFLNEIFTDVIQEEWGLKEFKFKFTGLDGRFTAEDIKTMVPIGIVGVDEARNDMGMSNIGVGNIIITGAGAMDINTALTTVSGTEKPQENEVEEPTEEQVTNSAKLSKRDINYSFEMMTRKPKYSQFEKAIKAGITKQLEPFTNPKTIERVTEVTKAENDDLIGKSMPSFVIKGVAEYLKWAATQGGQNAYDSIGIDSTFKLTNPKFLEVLGDRESYIIESVDDTTLQYLSDTIAKGKAAKLSNEQIAQQISDEIEGITSDRADLIVQTEVANAMGVTELATYKDQNIEKKRWVTSSDGLVCDICEEIDGEVVGIDDNFSNGVDAYPAHPRCRCYMQAVID